MPSVLAISMPRKPGGRKPVGTSSYDTFAEGLVSVCLEIVEKPWSAVTKMSVVATRPRSESAFWIAARLSSAFLIEASEVGPLMPGDSALRLSPWLCWVPSGSRDQNTSTNGLPLSFIIGSTALVAASAKYFCCSRLVTVVPGDLLSPALPLSPRPGALSGRPAAASFTCRAADKGMPSGVPVESSITIVFSPVRSV